MVGFLTASAFFGIVAGVALKEDLRGAKSPRQSRYTLCYPKKQTTQEGQKEGKERLHPHARQSSICVASLVTQTVSPIACQCARRLDLGPHLIAICQEATLGHTTLRWTVFLLRKDDHPAAVAAVVAVVSRQRLAAVARSLSKAQSQAHQNAQQCQSWVVHRAVHRVRAPSV